MKAKKERGQINFLNGGEEEGVPSVIASRAPAPAGTTGKLATTLTTWGPNASAPARFVAVRRATVHIRICWDADPGRRNVLGVPG